MTPCVRSKMARFVLAVLPYVALALPWPPHSHGENVRQPGDGVVTEFSVYRTIWTGAFRRGTSILNNTRQ